MRWAALIVWVITALGGFGLLAIWLQREIQQTDQPGRRIRPPLIFTHLGLAAGGLDRLRGQRHQSPRMDRIRGAAGGGKPWLRMLAL